jgi:hypothetical protein
MGQQWSEVAKAPDRI